MLQTIKNYAEAGKRRREEESEKGFSLIELIIVVVILGILVAVAIPIFGSIQTTARQNAVSAAAANGATAVAAAIANGENAKGVNAAAESAGSGDITVENTGSADDATEICVKATDGDVFASAGTDADCAENSWESTTTQGADLRRTGTQCLITCGTIVYETQRTWAILPLAEVSG